MKNASRLRFLNTPCRSLASLALVLVAFSMACHRDPITADPDALEPEVADVADAVPSRPEPVNSLVPLQPSPRAAAGSALPDSTPGEPVTIRFRDGSAASGIDFVHCSGKSPEKLYPTANGSGVAMFDYDGDGWLDLYFATTRNLPMNAPTTSRGNRLYRNLRNGKFEDVTERAGVGFHGFNHGVAVGDVDGNGYEDLVLMNFGPNVLYLNNGDGTFRDASARSGLQCAPWSSGAAMLDYDRDGDLDLYVTCYGQWAVEGPHPICGNADKGIRTYCSPLLMTPVRHFLLRNRGNATFDDVTKAAGILRSDGRGLGVIAADLNRDGWIDLYVANDMTPHFLFINKRDGSFEDLTETSGAAASESGYYQAGMGVDAEDVNGDGLPELLVTHFHEDYDTLYRNLDGRNFQDISSWSGIVKDSMPDVGWGCALADLDSDGWPDILTVNGHVDDNLDQLAMDAPQAEPAKVWRNQGDGRFRLVRDLGPFFATGHIARGAAFGDLNNDGSIDAVISIMDGHPAILYNESPRRSWIRLELLSQWSNRPAIGTVVQVHAGGRVIHRQLKGGGSYISANDPRLLVGLGSAESVDRVEILWPGGARTMLDHPALAQTHQVREPKADASALSSGDKQR
jgi:enediyne biosynthesis protein E4